MRQLANPHHHILTPSQAEDFAAVLRVLADPVRMRLVSLLIHCGPLRQKDLVGLADLAQPLLSHHLGKLGVEGLAQRVRKGRDVWFSVPPEALDYVASFLRSDR